MKYLWRRASGAQVRERNSSRYRRFGNAIGGRIWRRRPRGGSYWREPRYPSPPAGPTYSNAIGRVAMPTLWPWQWDTGCLVGCGDSTACPSLQVALAYSPGRSVHVTTRSISPQYPRSPMLSFATKKLSTGANGQNADSDPERPASFFCPRSFDRLGAVIFMIHS